MVMETKKSNNSKKNKVINTICLVVGIVLIIFSVIQLLRIFGNYRKSNALYDNLEQEYVVKNEPVEEETEKEVLWYEMAQVDFDALLAKNSDVCGWIFFENEDISYPVLHAADNNTYLRTTLDMEPATAGSIFVEALNNPDFNDYHTIIYGHNMRNLSMFGKLKFYEQKKNYYDEHQYFQIVTPDKIYRYQIFAYEQVPEDSDIYTVYEGNDGGYGQLLTKIASISEIPVQLAEVQVEDSQAEDSQTEDLQENAICVTEQDRIITLSTCVTGRKSSRFLVHAVLVDEVTNEKVDEVENE